MRPAEVIEDPSDPRLSDYVGLTDVVRRRKHEPENGFFIAEGDLVIARAAAAGYSPRSVLYAQSRSGDIPQYVEALPAPLYLAGADVLKQLTGFHVHRGALASFQRRALPTAAEVLSGAERLLVLEEMTSHTNLGAVFRSAAALGMDAVLLSPTSCDPLYRRAVRVSMGQVFAVPYAYLDDWPAGLDEVRRAGFQLIALTPRADAARLDEVSLTGRIAVLLGAEGPGLTDAALAASDLRVRIPMSAGVDSLNVAAAATVACWALGRRL